MRAVGLIPSTYKWPILWGALVSLAFAVLPIFSSEYLLIQMTEVMILALFAVSFNLLMGFGGMVSFGHGMFYAIGAYSTAILTRDLKLSLWLTFFLGPMVVGIFAFVIAPILIRSTAIYFSMLTLAISQLVYLVIWKWEEFTKGDAGIQGLSRPEAISSSLQFYYFTFATLLLFCLLLLYLLNTPLGSSVRAFRENRKRAEFTGINIKRVQIVFIIISAIVAGFAGSLSLFSLNAVTPNFAHVNKSFEPVLATILGGQVSFYGPLVGAITFKLIEGISLKALPTYWPLMMGGFFVIMTIFWWGGIVLRLQDPRWRKWLWVPVQIAIRIIVDARWRQILRVKERRRR